MTLKKKDRHFYHFLDIYNINLRVAVTKAQLKSMAKDVPRFKDVNKGHHNPAAVTMGRHGDNTYTVAFWVDKKKWKKNGSNIPGLAALCAHEATHGAGMIWAVAESKIDYGTLQDDENLPYLIGWLTNMLMKAVLEE